MRRNSRNHFQIFTELDTFVTYVRNTHDIFVKLCYMRDARLRHHCDAQLAICNGTYRLHATPNVTIAQSDFIIAVISI